MRTAAAPMLPILVFAMACGANPAPRVAPRDDSQPRILAWGLSSAPGAYELRVTLPSAVTSSAGTALVLRRVPGVASPIGFGASTAVVPATAFRGRRVRVSGEMRTESVERGASLWGRVDGPNTTLVLDNGQNRRLTGTTDWQPQELVIDVLPDAERIVFGAMLEGNGIVRVRRLTVAAVELAPLDAPTDADAAALLDSAIALARAHSLVRDTISWDSVAADLRRRVAGATHAEDAYPLVKLLATRLGDHHSQFWPPVVLQSSTGTVVSVFPDAATYREPQIVQRWMRRERLGYVLVPAHRGHRLGASRAFASSGRAALAAQRDSGACGWIVDLRGNNGGNMWPMLSALRPLLGDGEVGAFRSPTATVRWGTRMPSDPNDVYGRDLPSGPDLTAMPVAVLTDGRTASSGEAVATAFRGRSLTRSFGGTTFGLSTSNMTYQLPGGGLLLLTTAVYVDRTGTSYGGAIDPDVPVLELPRRDAPLRAAVSWLRAQAACRGR